MAEGREAKAEARSLKLQDRQKSNRGVGTGTHRLQGEEVARGTAQTPLVWGAARDSSATFPIVAKSAQWIRDVRFPLAPSPILEL